MKYTINGKEYTEFDINKRCAELEGLSDIRPHPNAKIIQSIKNSVVTSYGKKDYCNEPSDTWPIIEKCWVRLLEISDNYNGAHRDGQCTYWERLINEHNCTKLIAACICFIEMNEA